LSLLDTVGIFVPIFTHKQFITPEVLINRVTLKFVLNGVSLPPITLEQPIQAEMRHYKGLGHGILCEYSHVSMPWPQTGTVTSKR
jgi:hypothetical protein